jgi:hypothetical protein
MGPQDPRGVAFFAGQFERAGTRVTDTGAAFPSGHRGAYIAREPSLWS